MTKQIAIIGAGTMGNGIAHLFAQHGHSVNLIDNSASQLQKGLNTIAINLDRQIVKNKLVAAEKPAILNRIKPFDTLTAGVQNATFIIEAATENKLVKLELFKTLDALVDKTCVLASNTSSISITSLAAATRFPQRVIGMHFMNPVPMMPLVEIIKGYKTDPALTQQVVQLSIALEKTPCVVADFPGFVSNRILMPMINEAILTLQQGVANVEAIDCIMKLGMAHPMGPLQLADFIGLDVCLNILNVLYEGFGAEKYFPCSLLNNMVAAGQLGVKSGEGFYSYSNGSSKIVGVAENFS